MKKIVTLAVSTALVGGCLAACWYTGYSFDRFMAKQIAKVENESGLVLQWQSGSSNMFTRNGVLKLVVTSRVLAALSSELEGPLELEFAVKSRIMPLYIKSNFLLDTKQGSLAPVFTALGMEQWQFGLESVSSLWTRGNSSHFWADEFKVKQGLDEFHFLPLTGEFHGDLEGSGHVTIAWQGMTVHEEQSKMDLVLSDMKSSAELAENSGLWVSPQSEMSLSSLTIQQPYYGVNVSLQDMTTETKLNKGDNAQTLSCSYRMKLAKLNLENEPYSLAVTDSNLELHLNGLDLEGYQALHKGFEGTATQQALDKMLARGVTLELADLSAKFNGEVAVMKGEIKLASTSRDKLFNNEEGMQALSGQLHASLSDNLGKAVPQLAPMVELLTASGYLKAVQRKLNAELQWDKGVMKVNGQQL
ncbi:DUF945 family protein [Aeromonas jandaei]|uniref:DUF945 family protein n=1 Tax=Aeromonas jandaei TaxID=650 RepID=UPI001ADD8C70|nr:DUF945 family protein [Aeromonas jandaei]QTL94356.1 hypothetical protein AjGTCBM29_02219 [Aeromonas jandaei]